MLNSLQCTKIKPSLCELLQNSLPNLVHLSPAVLAAEIFKKWVKRKKKTSKVLYCTFLPCLRIGDAIIIYFPP